MTKSKDKNQTISEFLDSLMIEYVVAELRSKIYKKPKDKKYWRERVMKGKADKIKSIADRNGLPTIFNDDRIKDVVYDNVYGIRGYPKFVYKDAYEREELANKDFYNYYSINSEFRVDSIGDGGEVAYLKSVDKKNNSGVVKLKSTGEEFNVLLDNIARIL